jgi:hypothetical protein
VLGLRGDVKLSSMKTGRVLGVDLMTEVMISGLKTLLIEKICSLSSEIRFILKAGAGG